MDKSLTPLTTLVKHYLTTCRTEGKTPKTLRCYQEKLLRFGQWLDGTLADFTIDAARDYVTFRQTSPRYAGHPFIPTDGKTLSAQTVMDDVRTLKGFATWLWEEGFTRENILARLTVPKAPRKVIEILREDEIGVLLASVDPNNANGCRDLAILVLFLDTGVRCAELVSLKGEDVHLDEQWLKVMGKGQKERLIPFGARTAKVLMRYMTFFRPDTFPHPELFLTIDGEPITENTIKMLFTRLRKRTGIHRLHPHLLRHTFATSYLIAGGDVFTLQAILGHTTLEMTRRYVTLASSHINIQHRRFSPMDRMTVPALRIGGHPSGSGHHRAAGRITKRAS